MEKAIVVESGKKYGNMNTSKAFFSENYTQEEINKEFLKRRIAFGNDNGFDGHKMFMADQVDKIGSYLEITTEYVLDNPNGWSDINQDILLITDKVPGVVIGHSVADCPVVMMEDVKNGAIGVAHCSAEMIDKRLPMILADSMFDAYGSKDGDLLTYVSPCAGNNWTYDRFPVWATDLEIWKDGIYEKDGKFHIDMRKVINKQLEERNISNITFSPIDTITDPNYYSNSVASPYGANDSSKAGRHFSGLFFPDECYVEKVKTFKKDKKVLTF